MAAKRLSLGKDGILRTRDGEEVARVVSMTVELLDPPAAGGKGGAVEVDPQQALLGEDTEAGGGSPRGGSAFDPVPEVWAHYCGVMKPRNAGLDAETRKVIREALKVATVDECKRAISGCAASDFHMGKNDRNRRYNAVTQILKGKRGGRTTRENIDFFLDLAEKSGVQSGVPSGDTGSINAAKRDVLDAWEFPHDEHVQNRGRESGEWLTAQGWKVGQDDAGRPTFQAPGQE